MKLNIIIKLIMIAMLLHQEFVHFTKVALTICYQQTSQSFGAY